MSDTTPNTAPSFAEITGMLRNRLDTLDAERERIHSALRILTNGTAPAPTTSELVETLADRITNRAQRGTKRTAQRDTPSTPPLKLRERLVPMLRKEPLSTDAIMSALYAEGWTTTSATPRNVVYMMLSKHPSFKKTADGNAWTLTRKAAAEA